MKRSVIQTKSNKAARWGKPGISSKHQPTDVSSKQKNYSKVLLIAIALFTTVVMILTVL